MLGDRTIDRLCNGRDRQPLEGGAYGCDAGTAKSGR
jgi:hypothetical protein